MILRNKDVKLATRKKSMKNRIHILYTVVEMEDVTLVNNVSLCINTTRHDVAVWRGTVHKEQLST